MPRINADIPEDLNKNLKVHALRYNFKLLPDALVDVLKRFFQEENYDYFLKKNQEIKKSDPDFIKALNKEEKKK